MAVVSRNVWALGVGRIWHMPVGQPPSNIFRLEPMLCGAEATGEHTCHVTSIGDAPCIYKTCATCHERYVASLREPVKPEPLWSPYQDIAAVAS